jgi:AcrR family transcriptional regulator
MASRKQPTEESPAAAGSGAGRVLGRRERNKQDKLARITEAAASLFAERGVDDVTTQEIADRADIGTGTLFLYAKTKGELLLLVQNANYRRALADGITAATEIQEPRAAILAVLAPIVACNRVQVDNGRTYLREMVFGDPTEPRHAEALAIVAETEQAVAEILARRSDADSSGAAVRARIVSAICFLTMVSADPSADTAEVVSEIDQQLRALLT